MMGVVVQSVNHYIQWSEQKMMDVNEIRERLASRRIYQVAEKTGLNPGTIYNIIKYPCANPTRKTLAALTAYFGEDV